jgi:mannose-6-phosphate isomerase-like protein (cupin superfamily)
VPDLPIEAPPLRDGDLRGEDFVLGEWRDRGESSADRPIAPLHVHHDDDEAWYVLEGRLGFRRGEEVVVASAGVAVLVPRGTAHTFWNAGPGEARYVVVMTPRIAALIEALHDPASREDLPALFERHASQLL